VITNIKIPANTFSITALPWVKWYDLTPSCLLCLTNPGDRLLSRSSRICRGGTPWPPVFYMRILPETGGHGVPPLQLRPYKDRIFEAKLFVLETLLWDPSPASPTES